MTEFQQELIKIVLDNGLFGIVLIVFTYILNKKMEIFRAKNTYIQKLAEAKINAYQEISEILGKIYLNIIVYNDIMMQANNTISFNAAVELLQERAGNFVNDATALAVANLKYGMHTSASTQDNINAFIVHLDPITNFFNNLTHETARPVDTKELEKSLIKLYNLVINEVKANPHQ